MRNKFLTKILGATLGLAMAIGVGIGVAANNKQAKPVFADEESAYSIVFANSANGATGISSSTQATTTIASASRTYVDARPYTINSGNVYYGGSTDAEKASIRLGKSGNAASLSIALSDSGQVKATKFVVNCKTYNNSNAGNLNVNGIGAQAVPTSADDLTFTFASATDITSIDLSTTKATFIYSIEVFQYKAASKTLSSIAVTTAPTKTKYIPTESFDSTGMVVTATYSDASTAPVSLNDCTMSPATITAAGNVTITYQEKTATQAVTVYSITNVTGVVSGYPAQVDLNSTYLTKDDVLVNVACSDDEVIRTIHPTSISYDFSSVGTATVTCTFSYASGTKTASFDVDVVDQGNGTEEKPYTVSKAYRIASALESGAFHGSAVYVTGIISSTDAEIEINQHHGGSFNITDGYATLYAYNVNGCTKTNEDTFTQIGQYYSVVVHGDLKNQGGTLEIAYNNSADKVCVIESSSAPIVDSINVSVVSKTRYVGEGLTASDFVVTVNYTNGKPSAVIASGYTWVIGDGSSEVLAEGDNEVVVTYSGKNSSVLHVSGTQAPAKDIVATMTTQSSLTYHYSKTENTVDNVLDRAFTGKTGTSYGDDWSNNSTYGITYSGNSAGGNDAIQLRNNNNSGIVATANTSNRKARIVSVVWNSNTTNGRTVEVYGNNSAYSSPADLFGDSKGTLIGSVVKGTSTSLTIDDDYKFVGFKAVGGSLYLDSITVSWSDTSTYAYSSVAVKFGGKVTSTLWNRLNSESNGIVGYGVMLTEPSVLTQEGYGSIEALYYDAEDLAGIEGAREERDGKYYIWDTDVKYFYNPISTAPRLVDGNYVWDLVKSVNGTTKGLTRNYVAVAFIRTTDDGLIFLQETTKSAAKVADDIYTAELDETLDGSLGNLASLLG